MPDWQSARSGTVPENAFKAGRDDKGVTYICRARHLGDLLPGKVVPALDTAYVCYEGKEYPKDEYEVLCGYAYYWQPMKGGDAMPLKAVSAGHTAKNEPLLVGRVSHQGMDVIGKVHPSHKVCYIPYGGTEHGSNSFEVLVMGD